MIEALGDELYRPGQGGGSSSTTSARRRVAVSSTWSLAPTNEAADEAMLTCLPSLLGLG